MTPLVLLGVLVFIDGTLCGFRAAAGRNPRIFLWGYYGAAMRRGAVFAVATISLFLGAGLLLRGLGGDPAWSSLIAAASRLVLVYGVFATLVLAALGLYLLGSFDFGVLASVLVLGPFTLVRPVVILCGAAWVALSAPLPAALLAVCAAVVMARFEWLLNLGRPPWRGLEGDGN